MKLTQSVIAAATVYSVTSAVNVENTKKWKFFIDQKYVDFIDEQDASNYSGIKGALAACIAREESRDFCLDFKEAVAYLSDATVRIPSLWEDHEKFIEDKNEEIQINYKSTTMREEAITSMVSKILEGYE